MTRFRYGMALTVAGVALVLSGCGGGPSASRMDSGGGAPAAAPVEKANEATAGDSDQAAGKQIAIAPEQRSIIYVAEMTVRAKDVTKASEQAKQLVTGAGGYLANEQSDAFDGSEGSSTLVFKIPPTAYQGLLDRLGKELGKRESLRQNTTDVTEEVADVASRLKSAEQALASMRTLLTKATTVGQVIEVEREIATREAELESLQARQKALNSQVSMGTLTLRLIGPVATVVEPSDEPAGFLGGLKAGWSALVSFVKILLTVIGVLLPWLVLIVPVVVVILLLVRRGRTRRPAAPGLVVPSGRPHPVPGNDASSARGTRPGSESETPSPRATPEPALQDHDVPSPQGTSAHPEPGKDAPVAGGGSRPQPENDSPAS
ncbi:DUF4349 domain-containing protein [Nonomuraea mangrovi]|uniref:DUF4349 domain-containing protein n=1 Tax=Nonomuraea mangrovi TaxID=2316207 RepID=A0ABW4SXE6_9ACTN